MISVCRFCGKKSTTSTMVAISESATNENVTDVSSLTLLQKIKSCLPIVVCIMLKIHIKIQQLKSLFFINYSRLRKMMIYQKKFVKIVINEPVKLTISLKLFD